MNKNFFKGLSHPLLYAELVEKATKILFQTLFYIQDNGTTCQFSIRHENKAPEFVIVGKSHSYDNGWHAKVEQPDNKVVLDKQIWFNERWQNEGQYFLTFDNYETSFFFHSNNTTNGIDTMPVYSDKYFTLDVSQSDRFKTCLKFNRWMNKTLDTVVTCRTFQTASDSTCSFQIEDSNWSNIQINVNIRKKPFLNEEFSLQCTLEAFQNEFTKSVSYPFRVALPLCTLAVGQNDEFYQGLSHPLLFAEPDGLKILFQTYILFNDSGPCQFSIQHRNKTSEFITIDKNENVKGWQANRRSNNSLILEKEISDDEKWQSEGDYLLTFDNYNTYFFYLVNNSSANNISEIPEFGQNFSLDDTENDRLKTCIDFNRWMNSTLDTYLTCKANESLSDSSCSIQLKQNGSNMLMYIDVERNYANRDEDDAEDFIIECRAQSYDGSFSKSVVYPFRVVPLCRIELTNDRYYYQGISPPLVFLEPKDQLVQTNVSLLSKGKCQFTIQHEASNDLEHVVLDDPKSGTTWKAKTNETGMFSLEKIVTFKDIRLHEGRYLLNFRNGKTEFYLLDKESANVKRDIRHFKSRNIVFPLSENDSFHTCVQYNLWNKSSFRDAISCHVERQTMSSIKCSVNPSDKSWKAFDIKIDDDGAPLNETFILRCKAEGITDINRDQESIL